MSVSGSPSDTAYDTLARSLVAGGLLTDPWVDQQPRFATRPLRLPAGVVAALFDAAERVAAAYHEAMLHVLARPELLDEHFALTPVQQLLWHSSAPLWHGIARADLFLVDEAEHRPAICCELNCDTPSGQPEAVLLGPATGVPAERDPNRRLQARYGELLDHFLAGVDRDPGAPVTVGLIYPTEITGDFALIRLYQLWCQQRGWQVVLGSPYNLTAAPGGRVALFGTPCDLLIRHYKTDWWGERLPIWADEDPYPDPDPLAGPLSLLLPACADRRCAVVNPFGSVLAQNKRTMALLWERQDQLSPQTLATVREHLPETVRLEMMDHERLLDEQEDWVLKSDYGCEGEEVIIGRSVDAIEWRACLASALPRRWIAQRYFHAHPDQAGDLVNHGVYLVAGQAAGLYARLSAGATDVAARSAAVEVVP